MQFQFRIKHITFIPGLPVFDGRTGEKCQTIFETITTEYSDHYTAEFDAQR